MATHFLSQRFFLTCSSCAYFNYLQFTLIDFNENTHTYTHWLNEKPAAIKAQKTNIEFFYRHLFFLYWWFYLMKCENIHFIYDPSPSKNRNLFANSEWRSSRYIVVVEFVECVVTWRECDYINKIDNKRRKRTKWQDATRTTKNIDPGKQSFQYVCVGVVIIKFLS